MCRAVCRKYSPSRTLIIDIKDSDEKILARMKQKTRYNIRLAEKKGVTVRALYWAYLRFISRAMAKTY